MGGFISYDANTDTIKLAFQGTKPWSLSNWLHDLDILKTSSYCPDCEVHVGFQQAYLSIQPQVIEGFKLLRSIYPSSKISITGHSLGGAIATHCAVDLIKNLNEIDITLYTFG